MNILVVNDDGIDGIGIHLLAKALRKYGDVTVCAPNTGRSASSHAIIIHQPLSFIDLGRKDNIKYYKTNGMPADCVRLSLDLLKSSFDLVFSGINNGLNIGTDILYSGTVSAAREALVKGIPSVALSTDYESFDIVERELEKILDFIIKEQLYSKEYVLNVNFPEGKFKESKGIKFCCQGKKIFNTHFIKNKDNLYDHMEGSLSLDTKEDTDVYLASQGYITVVPLKIEQTHNESLEKLKRKFKL